MRDHHDFRQPDPGERCIGQADSRSPPPVRAHRPLPGDREGRGETDRRSARTSLVDVRCHPHERRHRPRAPRRDDFGAAARVREDPSRVRRALSFSVVQGNRQRRDDVRCDRRRVPRSTRILLAGIAGRMPSRAGEAHRPGAGTRGRGDGPLTTRLHDHEDRAHAGHGMRPLKALISLEEAMRIAMDLVHPIERKETVPILDALHRVSAEDVRSPIDVPLADRAAMDGYAVVARDTFPAGKFKPVRLRRIETLYAATVPRKRVASGSCTEVATGSIPPKGADAVVMVEDTEHDGDLVTIYSPVHPGEHVSGRGEDIARQSLVVREGEVLTPAKVGALAAIGLARASVYAKPRVSILTTGDEVVPPGPIRAGQVYDINSQTMASVVRENGGEPVLLGRVSDRLESLRSALKKAIRNDLVVFSGGSSVGEKDIVVDVLRSMGDLLFHGIAVKPGKPTVLGRVHGKAVLGMPGYPTSCLSNCYMILAPMLRRMARLPPRHERIAELPLAKRVVSTIGRVEFHTVRIVDGQAVPAYLTSEGVKPRPERITWAVEQVMRNRVGGVLLVAREKRAVVGVALAVYSPSAEEGRLLVLNDFFVDPAMRRKGVGKALATRLLEEAKEMRVERIDLEVTPTNAAAATVCKSTGFRPGGRNGYGRGIV